MRMSKFFCTFAAVFGKGYFYNHRMAENGLIFRCFASGSSGNCYYLGTRQQGILIDAGISARQIQKCLREMDLDFKNIMGVLVTHDHADHIRAVGTLGERVKLPIYTTAEIHEGIDRNYGVREKLRTSRRYFEKGQPWDIPIVFTGLRPGEKLYEELLNQKELTLPTSNSKIMIARVREFDYNEVSQLIDLLIETSHKDKSFTTVKMMKELVPEYISKNSIFEQLDPK